jgi:hypothetical protein
MFTFDEFCKHYEDLLYIHEPCGAECIHLRRFYEKAGLHSRSPDATGQVIPKKLNIYKLPTTRQKRKNSLERIVRKYYRYY